MKIKIIAAMDAAQAIGNKNRLPWRLPSDLQHFKRMTLNSVIVMGHTTFQSLPGMLPSREHWVLSRQDRALPEGVSLFSDIDSMLLEAKARGVGVLWVVGGADIYEQMLPLADELVFTQVETEVAEADTFFPDWKPVGFKLTQRVLGKQGERDEHAFEYEYWSK
jgi:dihydrofolate reductase